MNGTKSAALYGNKGSVDGEVENDTTVVATLNGNEARLFNFAGKIKLKGGDIAVTAAESSVSNKVFKSDKSITVKRGARITVDAPGKWSEAFSCADTFTMEGGTVEVVSGDDCVAAETNAAGRVTLTLATSADRDLGLVSRLSDAGPISDAVQVTPVWADNGTYYHVTKTYPDGSQLVEVSLLLGAVPEGASVRLEIFVSGVTFEDAVYAATMEPAVEVGLTDEIGSLEPGKRADLLILGDYLTIDRVMVGGVFARS